MGEDLETSTVDSPMTAGPEMRAGAATRARDGVRRVGDLADQRWRFSSAVEAARHLGAAARRG